MACDDWDRLRRIYALAKVSIDGLLEEGSLDEKEVPSACAFWHVMNNLGGVLAYAEDYPEFDMSPVTNTLSDYFRLIREQPEFRAKQLDSEHAAQMVQEIHHAGTIEQYVLAMVDQYK